MTRKFTLHLDATIVIVLLFAGSLGFNLFQRMQYDSLLTEHAQLQWDHVDLAINLRMSDIALQKCSGNPVPAVVK